MGLSYSNFWMHYFREKVKKRGVMEVGRLLGIRSSIPLEGSKRFVFLPYFIFIIVATILIIYKVNHFLCLLAL